MQFKTQLQNPKVDFSSVCHLHVVLISGERFLKLNRVFGHTSYAMKEDSGLLFEIAEGHLVIDLGRIQDLSL